MAKQLQLRRGTDAEHSTFTGAVGEVTVDTTNKTLRVHDGSTVGGIRLATAAEVVPPPPPVSLGVGQSWQDVTAYRALITTYTNSTGKPIQVSVVVRDSAIVADLYFVVNGTSVVRMPDLTGGSYGFQQLTITVPPMQTYRLETTNLLHSWVELR